MAKCQDSQQGNTMTNIFGLTNYHSHSSFCDGTGEPEDYAKEAIRLGFAAFGFSAHAPIPFYTKWTMPAERLDSYIRTVRSLRDTYRRELEVYLGLEIDFIPGMIGPRNPRFENIGLDYRIGSVHFIHNEERNEFMTVDANENEFHRILNLFFHDDIKAFVHDYYSRVRMMIREQTPDIIGHLDIVKKMNKQNRYFDESSSWYKGEISATLDIIAGTSAIMEVNTGGIARGAIESVYPSPWILKEAAERGIEVILNSDAHRPDHIAFHFAESQEILKRAGYRTVKTLLGGVWQDVEIP